MDRLKSRAAEIELRINAELFGEARVIACTLVGSAHHLLEGMKFGTLFIDEAAQALEAACWIPMKSQPGDSGRRPLSGAAYREEYCGIKSRTGQDPDGAHRRKQAGGSNPAEDPSTA